MSDEDFEAEVRAMLARRSADVSPSPAARRRLAVSETPVTGRPPLVIPLSRSRASSAPARRGAAAVATAAAVVIVVGLVAFVTSARTGDSLQTDSTAAPPEAPVIWPLRDDVAADVLATPETATRAYLSEVAHVPDEIPLGDTTTEGRRATVAFDFQDVGGRVTLRMSDGGWRVTQATNDAVDITGVALDGEAVDVGIAPGPGGWSEMTLRATAIDAAGDTLGTRTSSVLAPGAEDEVDVDADTLDGADDLVLVPPGPSTEPHSIRVDIADTGAAAPHAVRLDVMSDHDGDPGTSDVVLAHASQAITGPTDGTDTSGSASDAPSSDVASDDRVTSPGDSDSAGGERLPAPGVDQLFPAVLPSEATTVEQPGVAPQVLLLVAADGSELRFYESFTSDNITGRPDREAPAAPP